jgi:hypothetical protein
MRGSVSRGERSAGVPPAFAGRFAPHRVAPLINRVVCADNDTGECGPRGRYFRRAYAPKILRGTIGRPFRRKLPVPVLTN